MEEIFCKTPISSQGVGLFKNKAKLLQLLPIYIFYLEIILILFNSVLLKNRSLCEFSKAAIRFANFLSCQLFSRLQLQVFGVQSENKVASVAAKVDGKMDIIVPVVTIYRSFVGENKLSGNFMISVSAIS